MLTQIQVSLNERIIYFKAVIYCNYHLIEVPFLKVAKHTESITV